MNFASWFKSEEGKATEVSTSTADVAVFARPTIPSVERIYSIDDLEKKKKHGKKDNKKNM